MPPITWKNINIPSFGDAGDMMEQAGQTLGKALDPLEKILKDRAAVDEKNYDNAVNNNNRAIAERLEGIGSISELNGMEDEGLLSRSRATEAMGSMYDPKILEQGILDRRKVLQDRVVNEALPVASAIADERLSITDGLAAFRTQLAEAGMRADEIQKRERDFLTNNAARKEEYAQAIDDNTMAALDNVGKIGTNADITSALRNARETGAPINEEKFTNTLKGRLSGILADEQAANARTDRQKRLASEAEARTFMTQATGRMKKGESLNSIQSDLWSKEKISLDDMEPLSDMVTKQYLSQRQLEPEQQRLLLDVDRQVSGQIHNYSNQVNTKIDALEAEYVRMTGFTEPVKTFVKKATENGKNFIKELAKGTEHTWLHFSALSSKKQGDAAIGVLNKAFNGLTADGIPLDDAQMIMVLANQRGVDANQVVFDGEAIDQDALAKNVAYHKDKYLAGKELGAFITASRNELEMEVKSMKGRKADYISALTTATEDGNIRHTGRPTAAQVQAAQGRVGDYYQFIGSTGGVLDKVNARTAKKQEAVLADAVSVQAEESSDDAGVSDNVATLEKEAASSAFPGFTNVKVNDGWLWGTDPAGQTRRMVKIESPDIRYGDRVYPNPEYAENANLIKTLLNR